MIPPKQYAYLLDPGVPAVIREAVHLYGTVEYKGALDNPVILGWAQEVGYKTLGVAYEHDEVPWCGVFAAVVCKRAGFTPPDMAVRASAWDSFGRHVNDKPALGDILRFQRPGGGHVGFYVGEDADAYHVLGGNQSDAVTITRISKERCVAVRRAWPDTAHAVVIAGGSKLSENEA